MSDDTPGKESATADLGPHLLGRIVKEDSRDYKLEDYLDETAMDPLQTALDVLKKSHAAVATKAWATIATARILGTTPTPPAPSGKDFKWTDGNPVLDQGQQGTCVGHGWAQWGNTLPIDDHYTHNDALDIYYSATKHDGSPDDPRAEGGGQQGASVRGGAQAVTDKGRVATYAFTQDVDTMRKWVNSKGPLVFGTNWTADMFKPVNGLVVPTGKVEGGHCYACIGDLATSDEGWFINSWGPNWALKGYFMMKWSDVDKLMQQQGETCTAVELA